MTACSGFPALPRLPQPLRQGCGARWGDTLYVGLGSAGSAWYALDLAAAQPVWQRLADFPGVAREQPLALAAQGRIWVLGGAGQPRPGQPVVALDDMHCFDPVTGAWQTLPSAPRGLLGASACVLPSGPLAFFGGVNPDVFRAYTSLLQRVTGQEDATAALTRQYLSQPCDAYRFPAGVVGYDVQQGHWLDLGEGPVAGCAGSALVVQGDVLTLIHGEVKPGLRGTAIWHIHDDGDSLDWHEAPSSGPEGGLGEDGFAGAYAGDVQGTLLLAGGANFPGARARYTAGHRYAHEGLTKTWHDGIYALQGTRWQRVGQLPQGMGYGVSFALQDSLLLVGGEVQGGGATDAVLRLQWDGVAGRVNVSAAD